MIEKRTQSMWGVIKEMSREQIMATLERRFYATEIEVKEEAKDGEAKVDSVVEALKERMEQMEVCVEVPEVEGRVVDTVAKKLEDLQWNRPQTQASSSNFSDHETSYRFSHATSTQDTPSPRSSPRGAWRKPPTFDGSISLEP